MKLMLLSRGPYLGALFVGGTLSGCSPSPADETADGSEAVASAAGAGAGPSPNAGTGGSASGGSATNLDEPGTFWGQGRVAAVSLTYDDGLDGQLKHAVPALDERGLKGTFFLSSFQGVDHLWSLPNLSDSLTVRHDAWSAVRANGHELGGHTIHHPCDHNNPGYRPADYDLMRMGEELDEANQRLALLTGGGSVRSFAYPCATDATGLADAVSYADLVGDRYLTARVSLEGVSDPETVELHAVAQKFGDREGTSASELIAYVDEAIESGGWAVFTFHGIGPAAECDINQFDLEACALNYLTTENSEHEALLDYLAEKRSEVWTAPMGEVAEFITGSR